MNVADLITIVTEHLKLAKESEVSRLPALVLNECITALDIYQAGVIELLKLQQDPNVFSINFLCALVNDAANLMEEVDNLVEEYQGVAAECNIALRESAIHVMGGTAAMNTLLMLIMVSINIFIVND